MSFTIGSALTIIAILFGLAFSAWALLVGSTMIFRRKAETSLDLIRHAPFRSFFIGAVTLFVAGFVSAALLSLPLAIGKVLGYGGLMVALSLATVGAGGLVLLVAERLRQFDPKLRPFVALHRSSLLIVSSGLVPLLGLFVIFPAVLAIGIGAGLQAIILRGTARVEAEA